MNSHFLFISITLLLLHLSSCQYEIEIVLSFEDKEFKLEQPEKPEAKKYYKIFQFKNNIKEGTPSDLVIQFIKGEGYTTKIAIYKSKETIKQNTQNEFIDAIWDFELKNKEIIIAKDDPNNVTGDLFIVIYDVKFNYKEVFKIFNEGDLIELPPSACFSINHFYSLDKLSFHISSTANEFISFNLGSTVVKQPLIEIRSGSIDGAVVSSTDSNSVEKYIKIGKEIKDFYFIIHKGEVEKYDKEFNKHICYEFLTKQINVIKGDVMTKQFVSGMTYYFKVDVSAYALNEENAVLLEIDYTPTEAFSAFYCTYTKDDEDESKLIPQFPKQESDNKCAVTKDNIMDTSHNLFIKVIDKALDTLLITVKVQNIQTSKPKLRIALSQQITEITDAYDQNLDITIPRYFKINPKTMKANVIVFTTRQDTQSIIYGTLSNGKVATTPNFKNQLFAINKLANDDTLNVIYIRLYGGTGLINLSVMFTPSKIIYQGGDKSQSNGFPIEMYNCKDYVFYLSNYDQPSNDYLAFEQVYGMKSILYLDQFEDEKKLSEILPLKTNPKAKIITETTKINTNINLLEISCTSPMLLNIDFTPQTKPSTVKQGESIIFSLNYNEVITYDLTSLNLLGVQLKLETLKSTVEVLVNKVSTSVLKKNYIYFRDNPSKTDAYVLSFKATSEDGGIITMDLGGNQEVISEKGSIQKQRFILQLNSAIQFYSFKGLLETEELGLIACVSVMMNKPMYVPYQKNSQCSPISTSLPLNFKNSYDKFHDENQPETDKFLIVIDLDKEPTRPLSVDFIYDVKQQAEEKGVSSVILIDKNDYPIRTQTYLKVEKDLMFLTFTPCTPESKINYSLHFDKEKVDSAEITNRVMKQTFNLYGQYDIKLTSTKTPSGVLLYSFASTQEYNEFKEVGKYDITATMTNGEIEIKFPPYVLNVDVEYSIYAIKSEDKNALINSCSLLSYQPETVYSANVQEADHFLSSKIAIKEKGKYQINIQAQPTNKVITYRLYNPIEVVDKSPDDDKPSSYLWLWILLGCLGGIALIGLCVYAYLRYRRKHQTPALESLIDRV